MPIYEYTCEACHQESELLVSSSAATPNCPHCGSPKMTKKFSTFSPAGTMAKVTSAPAHVHTPTCGCGRAGGSCGLN